MPKYSVEISWNETWTGRIVVEANSAEEARRFVSEEVGAGEMIYCAEERGCERSNVDHSRIFIWPIYEHDETDDEEADFIAEV